MIRNYKVIDFEICPVCGERGRYTTFAEVVDRFKVSDAQDRLRHHRILFCNNGHEDAWVRCHRRNGKPMGYMAIGVIRYWRTEVHKVFDPIWQNDLMQRHSAYNWLANELDIPVINCHIAHFTIEQCAKAMQLAIDKFEELDAIGIKNTNEHMDNEDCMYKNKRLGRRAKRPNKITNWKKRKQRNALRSCKF